MSEQKSRWQNEFDALPEWAQEMVRALNECTGFGGFDPEQIGLERGSSAFHVLFKSAKSNAEWFDGFCDMRALADALTAPWPPPAPPEREKRAVNVVEMVAESEDCAFDQPCAFGHRVETHAVYCHNEAWPNSPRKCRRDRSDYLHEDCPGFVANPDYEKKH